jgi:hypothetical protein
MVEQVDFADFIFITVALTRHFRYGRRYDAVSAAVAAVAPVYFPPSASVAHLSILEFGSES